MVDHPAMTAGSAADPDATRERLLQAIDAGADEAIALSQWMASAPELSLHEVETSARYRKYLAARHFEIAEQVAGMPTAFTASFGSARAPLHAALLAEMDALPGIGHACGHNLSGPASLLAASALARVLPPEAAQVTVIGCPAEETGVGKRTSGRGGRARAPSTSR